MLTLNNDEWSVVFNNGNILPIYPSDLEKLKKQNFNSGIEVDFFPVTFYKDGSHLDNNEGLFCAKLKLNLLEMEEETKDITAVDYLLDNLHYLYSTKWDDIVEKARELHKEQIIKSYNSYYSQETMLNGDYLKGEQYYEETYGSNDDEQIEKICPKCGSYDWNYYMATDKMECYDCGFKI